MEKLLTTHKTLIQSESDMTSPRLAIVGQCDEDKQPHLNTWLKRVALIPKAAPKPESSKEKTDE